MLELQKCWRSSRVHSFSSLLPTPPFFKIDYSKAAPRSRGIVLSPTCARLRAEFPSIREKEHLVNLTQQPVSILFLSCFRADRGPNKTVPKETKTAVLRVVTGCDAGTRAGAQVCPHPPLSSSRQLETALIWNDTCWTLSPKRLNRPPACCRSRPPLESDGLCKGGTQLRFCFSSKATQEQLLFLKAASRGKTRSSACLTSCQTCDFSCFAGHESADAACLPRSEEPGIFWTRAAGLSLASNASTLWIVTSGSFVTDSSVIFRRKSGSQLSKPLGDKPGDYRFYCEISLRNHSSSDRTPLHTCFLASFPLYFDFMEQQPGDKLSNATQLIQLSSHLRPQVPQLQNVSQFIKSVPSVSNRRKNPNHALATTTNVCVSQIPSRLSLHTVWPLLWVPFQWAPSVQLSAFWASCRYMKMVIMAGLEVSQSVKEEKGGVPSVHRKGVRDRGCFGTALKEFQNASGGFYSWIICPRKTGRDFCIWSKCPCGISWPNFVIALLITE